MNKYTLSRDIISNKAILGTLLDGDKILARTLENPHRNSLKDSAIPAGKYKCVKDNTGKFQYWRLLNVKGRENIELHNGNFESDTEGCILFGKEWAIMKDQLAVTSSKETMTMLQKILPSEFELEIIE